MGPTSRETWAKRVERWKESGLTAVVIVPCQPLTLRPAFPAAFRPACPAAFPFRAASTARSRRLCRRLCPSCLELPTPDASSPFGLRALAPPKRGPRSRAIGVYNTLR